MVGAETLKYNLRDVRTTEGEILEVCTVLEVVFSRDRREDEGLMWNSSSVMENHCGKSYGEFENT